MLNLQYFSMALVGFCFASETVVLSFCVLFCSLPLRRARLEDIPLLLGGFC